MFWNIFSFELRCRIKRLSTYMYFALFFLTGYFVILFAGDAFRGANFHFANAGVGKMHANAPYALFSLITIMSHFGILIISAFFGGTAYRDFKDRIHSLSFSYPVSKIAYIGGKFSAALVTTIFVFSGTGLGALAASSSKFVNPEKFGPVNIWAYIQPYLTGVLPNVIFLGAIFFSVALLSRKIFPVHLSSIAVLTGYILGNSLVRDISGGHLGALLDPFGKIAMQKLFIYWTAAEKNSLLVPFSDDLLLNRLLWLAIGLGVIIYAYRKFSFTYVLERKKQTGREKFPSAISEKPAKLDLLPIKVKKSFSTPVQLRQMLGIISSDLSFLVRNIYFILILILGVAFMFIRGLRDVGAVYGTETYPVTYQVLEITSGAFFLFLALVIIIFSGELVWRERDRKAQQIYDSLPVPEWATFLGKLGALFLVQVFMMAFVMAGSMALQIMHGYYKFEIGLYITELFGFRLVFYLLLSVLTMFIHVLVSNKYLGHFVVILYLTLEDIIPMLGFEHKIYRFASSPEYTYSDMNGYGPFLKSVIFFNIYWSFFAGLLVVVSILLWVRGNDQQVLSRLGALKTRFTKRMKSAMLTFFALWVILGGCILYNTNILNDYSTEADFDELRADFEKKYKEYSAIPQPRVTDISVELDIYPDRRKAVIRAKMTLANKLHKEIKEIFVNYPLEASVKDSKFDRTVTLTRRNRKLGIYIYRLETPMTLGETITLEYSLMITEKGFRNNDENTRLVRNGTFLVSDHLIPVIGYSSQWELDDNDKRKKHGLAAKSKMPSIEDKQARMNTYISTNSDWINFEAVVSTSADQTAITSGALVKEWKNGERKFFHYKPAARVLNFFSFLSAKYEVQRDRWKDVDIEVYFHESHGYNINRMIDSVKKSLEYCTVNFSPYPYKIVRIVEFPRYETFAQSFATLIPYSESIGFIARVNEEDIDYVFDVTAHETAHQWWAHQVISANTQGATLMTEVLAQYTALMIDKNKYSKEKISRYLRYEREIYLRGRANETEVENPLYLNENKGYLHYQKGILVMNSLAGYLGEENLNMILQGYLRKSAFSAPPYPVSTEFLEYLKSTMPENLKYLITDMFEKVIIFDMKVINAEYQRKKNGEHGVNLEFEITKTETDETGTEKEIDIKDYITIELTGEKGEVIYSERRYITSKRFNLLLNVNVPPIEVAIDPDGWLIDKNLKNNILKVRQR